MAPFNNTVRKTCIRRHGTVFGAGPVTGIGKLYIYVLVTVICYYILRCAVVAIPLDTGIYCVLGSICLGRMQDIQLAEAINLMYAADRLPSKFWEETVLRYELIDGLRH